MNNQQNQKQKELDVTDRQQIEAYLEKCGQTNFQVIARGISLNGTVKAILEKKTQFRFEGTPETVIREAQTTGLRHGLTVDGPTRVFGHASNLAQGGDWVRAISTLVECGYYLQVELCPLKWIIIPDGSSQTNPLADLAPLLWRIEDDGTLTRQGQLELGTPLSITLENFLASKDFQSGVISSTLASWGGSGYSVELFPNGRWSVLWDNQIGNLYESPGKILSLPDLDTEDMAEYIDGGAGSQEEFLRLAFAATEEELKVEMREKL